MNSAYFVHNSRKQWTRESCKPHGLGLVNCSGRTPLTSDSLSYPLFEEVFFFVWGGNTLGLVPASLPYTLGYACTLYTPTSPLLKLPLHMIMCPFWGGFGRRVVWHGRSRGFAGMDVLDRSYTKSNVHNGVVSLHLGACNAINVKLSAHERCLKLSRINTPTKKAKSLAWRSLQRSALRITPFDNFRKYSGPFFKLS